MRTALMLPLLSLVFAGTAVAAPPRLMSSTPADAAAGVKAEAIRLAFDQAVLTDSAHFTLQMVSMPGMAMGQPSAVAINAVNHDGPNKLDLGLQGPLSAGRYELQWSVANTAGETSKGVLHFGVQ